MTRKARALQSIAAGIVLLFAGSQAHATLLGSGHDGGFSSTYYSSKDGYWSQWYGQQKDDYSWKLGYTDWTRYFKRKHDYTKKRCDDGKDVPEPGSLALMALGLVGAAGLRRRSAARQR